MSETRQVPATRIAAKSYPNLDPGRVERIERIVATYEQRIMAHVDEEHDRAMTNADHLADRIASFGGSWPFILWFGALLGAWILWNVLPVTRTTHFDPAPFILLNLVLSFLAAFQAPIILMSQNRQAAHDRREAVIDFAINYRAGVEVDDMQQHLHRMEDRLEAIHGLLAKLQAQQMT